MKQCLWGAWDTQQRRRRQQLMGSPWGGSYRHRTSIVDGGGARGGERAGYLPVVVAPTPIYEIKPVNRVPFPSHSSRPIPFHFAPSSPAVSLCLLPLPTHTSPDPCPTPQAHPLVYPSLANPLESAHMMVLLRTMCADAE